MIRPLVLLSVAALLTSALAQHDRDVERHRVVVVGAGVAGLSAAATLLEHNASDVIVLEASDRIGGRAHTLQFEGVAVDEGAEFVHGEKDNAVYELVRAYDLLVSYEPLITAEKQLFVNTLGHVFNSSEVDRLNKAAYAILEDSEMDDFNGSVSDFFYPRFDKFLASNNVSQELGEALKHYVELEEQASNAADSMADMGGRGYSQYKESEGDQTLKWKTGGWKNLFDDLLKKFPNPSEELPVLNKTVFGKRVTLIRLREGEGEGEGVEVECEDGSRYLAHHVIVTTSLGVLKKHAHSMFQPALPANKIAAIQALGFGTVAKVFLKFGDRWWPEDINVITPLFSQRELRDFQNSSVHGSWTADIAGFYPVMWEERMLCVWLSGQACRSMEALDEHQVVDGILELLNRTLGNRFNISRPLSTMRSRWWNNPLTLGTYSFRTVQSDRLNISNSDLAQPILGPHNKPVVLFAGEATHPHHYSTVHGALETGRREAHNILNYIKNEKEKVTL